MPLEGRMESGVGGTEVEKNWRCLVSKGGGTEGNPPFAGADGVPEGVPDGFEDGKTETRRYTYPWYEIHSGGMSIYEKKYRK